MGRNIERDERERAARKQRILEAAFPLLAEKGIDAVSMNEIADACSIGIATLYRHYRTKADLVLAISAWKWDDFMQANDKRLDTSAMTAAENFDYYLETFLYLYRNYHDLLRFNHYFNGFVEKEQATQEQKKGFLDVVETIAQRFHKNIYVKAENDETLRTDISEEEMFSTTLHLMLSAITRYSVGLVFQNSSDMEKELLVLKKMLLREYVREFRE